ncbi:MAG: hypothetical protein ABI216_13125 [Devosia sp.]
MADLVEAYENRHWPFEAPTPIEALTEFMKMREFTQSDLAALLGSKSRASEVLDAQRQLSLDMIPRISSAWHLPADVIIDPSSRQKKTAA